MATMPLLSPSESYKFHSALIDYSDGLASEWSMYASEIPVDLVEDNHHPSRERSGHLAKATKDLISLDGNAVTWNQQSDRDVMSAALPTDAAPPMHMPSRGSNAYSSSPSASASMHRFGTPAPAHVTSRAYIPHQQRRPLTVVPNLAVDSSAASDSQQSASSVTTDTTSPPPTPPTLKRPYSSSTSDLSPLNGPGANFVGPSSPCDSSVLQSLSKKARTSSSSPHQSGPILNSKPTLLTPSQKKANHIQSEQKRRANIRKGYEALCETVPTLREAIRAEEEALATARAQYDDDGVNNKGKSKRKTRIRKSLCETGEKIDGRAGPRSENIVLQKTIDYINDLLSEHVTLLDRLNYARSKLCPGHPALNDNGAPKLWEREWKGGLCILEDGDAGEDVTRLVVGPSRGGVGADVDADADADGTTADADSDDDEADDS